MRGRKRQQCRRNDDGDDDDVCLLLSRAKNEKCERLHFNISLTSHSQPASQSQLLRASSALKENAWRANKEPLLCWLLLLLTNIIRIYVFMYKSQTLTAAHSRHGILERVFVLFNDISLCCWAKLCVPFECGTRSVARIPFIRFVFYDDHIIC